MRVEGLGFRVTRILSADMLLVYGLGFRITRILSADMFSVYGLGFRITRILSADMFSKSAPGLVGSTTFIFGIAEDLI